MSWCRVSLSRTIHSGIVTDHEQADTSAAWRKVSAAVNTARDSLALAVQGREQEAVDLVAERCNEFPGLTCGVVQIWCDYYRGHSTGESEPDPDAPIHMVTQDPATGRVVGLTDDEVPAHTVWHTKIVLARLRMDEAAFKTAWEELPDDAEEFTHYVISLLLMVAHTIKHLPRGYARQHWASTN